MLKRLAARWKGKQVRVAFEAHKAEARKGGALSNLDHFWTLLQSVQTQVSATMRYALLRP